MNRSSLFPDEADFIPSRVYQNRQHMRAFPTVDDWLGTISERPIKMRRSRSVGGPSAALMGGSIKNKGPRVGGAWSAVVWCLDVALGYIGDVAEDKLDSAVQGPTRGDVGRSGVRTLRGRGRRAYHSGAFYAT